MATFRFLSGAWLALAFAFGGGSSVFAAPSSPELLIDVSSGTVIYADEATRAWFPASTTKLMTAYVALRAIKAGTLKLDTPLIASARAASQPPSKIGIRPGQEITFDNALKILMVKSANDLAVVIAEGIGGSVDGFAAMMNAEAARLGMRESHFVNPHGLHSADHVSSARDLAILGRALLVEFPDFRDYWGIGAVQLGSRVMKNTNGLIGRYPGAEGMKTGFVCPSGFNVVALANRGGRTMLAVVLGAGSGAERTIRTAQLLDKGFGGSMFGGGQGTVNSLGPSGFGAAPNMRQEICRKGRQIPLGEEEEGGGAISMPLAASDSSSVYSLMVAQPVSGAARSVGGKSATGRATLGPRAELPTISVFLGRAPGSTEVARGPGKAMPKVPASAASFAAVSSGAVRPAVATRTAPDSEMETLPAGAPLQLPGVMTAPGPGAIGLRTGAKGKEAPRPPNPGAIQPKVAPSAVTAARPTAEKQPAAKQPTIKSVAKATADKARPKGAAAPKAKPKTPAADDE